MLLLNSPNHSRALVCCYLRGHLSWDMVRRGLFWRLTCSLILVQAFMSKADSGRATKSHTDYRENAKTCI